MGPFQVAGKSQALRSFEITSNSAEQTRRIGAKLGKLAAPGDVILLVGPLGAGKTCLTQGIAHGLSVNGYAASPSFVLVREHQGRLPLYHIDLYRLDRIEEIAHLGLDDYLYGNGVCVVEWGDKGISVLPEEHLLIEIQFISRTKRRLAFSPKGARHINLLSKMEKNSRDARK